MSLQQYAVQTGSEISNQACALTQPLSLSALSVLIGAEAACPAGADQFIERVCIDSRAARAKTVFVALKGERVDGHDFLTELARLGCFAAVVARSYLDAHPLEADRLRASGMTFLVVADPLAALQSWAASYLRQRSELLRIGVTGSNGKTTTKDLLARVLSTRKRTFVSPGNLNSVIGLPLAALAVPAEAEVAVFEMAMSEAGEMSRLARIVFPGFAVVTNVGTAHIGNIGTQAGIALEKKQIFSAFTGAEQAFLPGSDDFAGTLAQDVRGTVHYFGEMHSAGYQGWAAWEQGQIIHWRDLSIQLKAAGRHLRSDALAVIAVAEALGYAPAEIKQGLESWSPSFGRNELLRGRVNLVLDCYNANPDSMAASLEAFVEMAAGAGRRVAVLGDMRELGEHSVRAHAELGEHLARLELDLVLFFGPEMAHAWRAWRSTTEVLLGTSLVHAEHHVEFIDLAIAAGHLIADGDLVLLKASRGMELERLVPVLMEPARQSGS